MSIAMNHESVTAPMTKSQVVAQIRRINASAPREWLETFDFRALERYLDRLRTQLRPARAPDMGIAAA